MKKLVMERQAIKNNLAVIKARAGAAAIYGVLTGDGGGGGTAALARLLRDEGIGRFAVSEPSQAEDLRKAGLVDEEILMLRSTACRETLHRLLDLNVVCTIGTVEAGLALNTAAEERSTVAEAHVQVDAGLGYGGFPAGEPEKILTVYQSLPNVAISGIYTQVHAHSARGKEAAAQLARFHQAVAAVHAAGIESGLTHTSGSYALLHCDLSQMDGVRVGSALLGRCGRTRGDGLLRVGYGEAPIQETRWLPRGYVISGERPVTLSRPTRVAVLPVGYQNGFGVSWSREAGLWAALRRWWRSRHVTVRLHGEKIRVIGRIGAMETLLDVTDRQAAPGDLAYFDIDPLYARGLVLEYR